MTGLVKSESLCFESLIRGTICFCKHKIHRLLMTMLMIPPLDKKHYDHLHTHILPGKIYSKTMHKIYLTTCIWGFLPFRAHSQVCVSTVHITEVSKVAKPFFCYHRRLFHSCEGCVSGKCRLKTWYNLLETMGSPWIIQITTQPYSCYKRRPLNRCRHPETLSYFKDTKVDYGVLHHVKGFAVWLISLLTCPS